MDIHQLKDTFAVLTPELAVKPVPLTPSLYQDLDRDFADFKGHLLIAMHSFSENWPTWENHPAGDELVMLLSGKASLTLRVREEEGFAEQTVQLAEPGAYVVVPRDTWHTARVSEPCSMLFITPGEGTQNSPQPETSR